MTRQPGHLNGSKNKNFRGSNENWRTGSTCVGFSSHSVHFSCKYKCPLPCLLFQISAMGMKHPSLFPRILCEMSNIVVVCFRLPF